MSTDNIQALYDKAQHDPALRQKLQAIEESARQEYAAGIVRLAEQAGTPFTTEEFLAATTPAQELSEEELSGVAGGVIVNKTKSEMMRNQAQSSQRYDHPTPTDPNQAAYTGLNPNYKK